MVSVLDISLYFPLVSCANKVGLCGSTYHVYSADMVDVGLLEQYCRCAVDLQRRTL